MIICHTIKIELHVLLSTIKGCLLQFFPDFEVLRISVDKHYNNFSFYQIKGVRNEFVKIRLDTQQINNNEYLKIKSHRQR